MEEMHNMPKIHAYFDSMSDAGKALGILAEKGHKSAHLDMSGAYDYEYSHELSVQNPGNSSEMSAIVIKSGGSLLDLPNSPLIAAGTTISGASHINDSRNVCTKLIVNINDEKKNEIESIIIGNGGRIFPTFIE